GMSDVTWLRLVALVAFAGTYLGLALGHLPGFRVDRTGVAIIGATVMVVAGVLPWEKAVAAVDAHTLVLLFGLMIVAASLGRPRSSPVGARGRARRGPAPGGPLAWAAPAPGGPWALLATEFFSSAPPPGGGAGPGRPRLPPVPYLLALATAANVGSVAT